MQEQEKKSSNYEKNKRDEKYRCRFSVVVSIPEGETLKQIISDNGCKNLSQLCKKIVSGEISIY